MLVLSRQRDETIMIGDDVEITIVDIRGDKVRLGISAPPYIAVHRKEVYEAIRREKQGQTKDGSRPVVESLANRKDKHHVAEPPEASPPTQPAVSPTATAPEVPVSEAPEAATTPDVPRVYFEEVHTKGADGTVKL